MKPSVVLVGAAVRRQDVVLLMGMAVMIDAELLALDGLIAPPAFEEWLGRALRDVADRRRQRWVDTVPEESRGPQ